MTTTVVLPNWYHELQWAVAHPGPFELPYSWVDSVALEWSKESTAQALIMGAIQPTDVLRSLISLHSKNDILKSWQACVGKIAIEHAWDMGGPQQCRLEWISSSLNQVEKNPAWRHDWVKLCGDHKEYWDETMHRELLRWDNPRSIWMNHDDFNHLHASPGPRILFATLAYLDITFVPRAPGAVEQGVQRLHSLFPDWFERVRAVHAVWTSLHELPSSKIEEQERFLQLEPMISAQHFPASTPYPASIFDAVE